MEKFLSCDWGTSSFRVRLVEVSSARVIAEENSDDGIAKAFDLWKQDGRSEDVRFHFYFNIIRRHVNALRQKLNFSLDGLPLVISGMACSTLGMIDLPYKDLPFATDGSDLITKLVEATDNFSHDIIFISGARTHSDAMRGEETQLVGCFTGEQGELIFIFPGTHSKHVTVKNGKATDFKTYMTGEFFELLSMKSTLYEGITKGTGLDGEGNIKSFEEGVRESLRSDLLHGSFKVRTNYLFNRLSQQENYYFLSGLLIGTEVKQVTANNCKIILVSDPHMGTLYETAFNLVMDKRKVLKIQNADDALVAGQLKILHLLR